MEKREKIVIVGGGFGGLNTAKSLRRAHVDVTLIDKRNFHLFQPLLYQVATGGLSPANIAAPLRHVFRQLQHRGINLAEPMHNWFELQQLRRRIRKNRQTSTKRIV